MSFGTEYIIISPVICLTLYVASFALSLRLFRECMNNAKAVASPQNLPQNSVLVKACEA